jgi:hypothetical protein
MPRGYVWAGYQDDTGAIYAARVDADYQLQVERGWQIVDRFATPQLPRGWIPRRVVGVDENGNSREAICATTQADLWTGAVIQFTFNGSDQLPHVAQVIARHMEHTL